MKCVLLDCYLTFTEVLWSCWGILLTVSTNLCSRTSNTTKCLNLGSYNYLGFAAADEYCTPHVIDSLKKYSCSTCSVRVDGGMYFLLTILQTKDYWMWNQSDFSSFWSGTTDLHTELEELVARFVGKPAAITFGMGYVTNSAIIPALVGKVCLIPWVTRWLKALDLQWWDSYRFCYPTNTNHGHSQGGLIISDSLNHNSIVNGARGSGAAVRVFQHNSKF